VKTTETDGYEYRESNNAPFNSFDTLNGELAIFTQDRTLAGVYSIKWRIRDSESLTDASYVEEISGLTVISVCTTNKITSSGSSLAAQTYYLGDAAQTVSP
jgi:hypothetical protein